MLFRRAIQSFSLGIFLVLVLAAATGLTWVNLDFFLRLDPALVLISALGARTVAWAFAPAIVLLLAGLLLGRVFCSYICPMGTTLDAADWLFGRRRSDDTDRAGGLRRVKYLLLGFLIGAAVLNVSFVFIAAPLSLITRFYGLIVHPLAALGIDTGVSLIQPLADVLDLREVTFLHVKTPRFSTQYFVLAFFCVLFAAAAVSPRFWCRSLCPAGALMALFSRKPLIRRRVSDDCTACGKCIRSCPMGAIDETDPRAAALGECISCGTCQHVCPEQAVIFSSCRVGWAAQTAEPALITRRQFLTGGVAGAGVAAVGLTGLASPLGRPGEGRVLPPGLVRPPGARPEIDFLSRCVRCAECMLACPTNTLQPIWLSAGLLGLFSPALTPRRGYCDPRCHRCAEVCPTDSIRCVALSDRIWAKTGTAVIERQRCLAWEHQKSCMVCDEVCPYDAIDFKRQAGNRFAVPHVQESRCAGCGFCEHYCPVQNRAAIVVSPMGALRQNRGAYRDSGRQQGLDLRLKATAPVLPATVPGDGGGVDLAPGFDPE